MVRAKRRYLLFVLLCLRGAKDYDRNFTADGTSPDALKHLPPRSFWKVQIQNHHLWTTTWSRIYFIQELARLLTVRYRHNLMLNIVLF